MNNTDTTIGAVALIDSINSRLEVLELRWKCSRRSYNPIEKAVYTVLKLDEERARHELLENLVDVGPKEMGALAYIFKKAYDKELHPLASAEWDLLSTSQKGKIKESLRLAVFLFEGEMDVRVPLSNFSLDIAGLPLTLLEWKDWSAARAKMDVLATAHPVAGLSRVIARAMYPLMKGKPGSSVANDISTPPWTVWDNRKGLWEVTQGILEAFEAWVDDRKNAKLNPLTRGELFTGINDVVVEVSRTSSDLGLRVAAHLVEKHNFSTSEIIRSHDIHHIIQDYWSWYSFGATVAGVLDVKLKDREKNSRVMKEWAIGFLSRYTTPYAPLTEVEKREPIVCLERQLEDALDLDDSVEVYINFHRILNRFRGCQYTDPVDPGAKPVDVVDKYKNKYPVVPKYDEVIAWRTKQLQAVSDTLS